MLLSGDSIVMALQTNILPTLVCSASFIIAVSPELHAGNGFVRAIKDTGVRTLTRLNIKVSGTYQQIKNRLQGQSWQPIKNDPQLLSSLSKKDILIETGHGLYIFNRFKDYKYMPHFLKSLPYSSQARYHIPPAGLESLQTKFQLPLRKDKLGIPLLNLLTRDYDLDIMKKAIDLGADVNAADYRGVTPLHEAAATGSWDKILFLLNNGADLHATYGSLNGKKGFSVVIAAAMGDTYGCISCSEHRTGEETFLATQYHWLPKMTERYYDKFPNRANVVKHLLTERNKEPNESYCCMQ